MRKGLTSMRDWVSLKGDGGVNEDLAGAARDFAWVLDGATPVSNQTFFSARDDAQWIVMAFDRLLREAIEAGEDSLKEVLRKSFEGLVRAADRKHPVAELRKAQLPSFAMAIARFTPEQLDYALLADCDLVAERGGGVLSHLTDHRIQAIRQSTLDKYLELAGMHGRERALELLEDKLADNRQRMNTAGGYYVGTLDPACADMALLGRIPAAGLGRVLLCSDGFSLVVKLFRALTWEELFSGTSLADAAHLLRAREAQDPLCEAYPRVKVSDDATAVMLRLS